MIIVGISSSIAAYKSIELIKLLLQEGKEVKIVLTKSAEDFISPLTLKSLFPRRVYLHNDTLGENDEMLHITLAKAAKLILIAPASANTISKIAHGSADCLLTNICLATKAPIALAPAMNKVMWENDFVQQNIALIKKESTSNPRFILGPTSGLQACGDDGLGRMLEPYQIFELVKYLGLPKILADKNILINAGPTIEPIDPVRFISNHSSGKMGYALAKLSYHMGANVTLISGATHIDTPYGVNLIKVQTAEEMHKACLSNAAANDIFIATAAVADFRVKNYQSNKIKKSSGIFQLELENNIDILSEVAKNFSNLYTVGFAAETNNFLEYGTKKLKEKQLNLIAINDVSGGQVFNDEYNQLFIIDNKGKEHIISRALKEEVALKLLEIIHNSML